MPLSHVEKMQQRFLKKFGDYAMTSASDRKAIAFIPYGISAQCLSLDLALGRPGFPAGRLTEIFGHTGTGKSTLSYHLMAECQRQGGIAVLLETEMAFEAERLQKIGVNVNDLILLQPKTMDQVFSMLDMAIQEIRGLHHHKGPLLMVVDSIAGTKSAAEEEAGFGELSIGVTARVVAQSLRKLVWPLGQHKIALVFINQLSHTFARFGEQFVTYGGSQIHKSSSIRLRLSNKQSDLIKRGTKILGVQTLAWFQKNKLAPQFQSAKYALLYDRGIDPIEDLWVAGVEIGAIKETGKQPTFSLNGKSVSIERSKWEAFVMEKFKSPAALRERLTKVAIEQGLLRPYGDTK